MAVHPVQPRQAKTEPPAELEKSRRKPGENPILDMEEKLPTIPPETVVAKIAVGILASPTHDQWRLYAGLMREYLKAKGPVIYTGVDGYQYSFAYLGDDPGWQVIPLGPSTTPPADFFS
jgi:hypothetical protein